METALNSEIDTEKPCAPGGPITEDPTRSTDSAVRPKSGATTEGQILLDALKSFAASFSNSPNGPQMAEQLPENSDQDHQDAGLSSQCILTSAIPDSGTHAVTLWETMQHCTVLHSEPQRESEGPPLYSAA